MRGISALAILGLLLAAWISFDHGPGVAERPIAEFGNIPAYDPPMAEGFMAPEPARQSITVTSGSLAALQQPVSPAPVRIGIASISLDAPIEAVGYDPGKQEMEVPRSGDLVGWYKYGPTPGDPGSSVLAAHVDWNKRPGAFYQLSRVQAGELITVEYADGTARRFRIVALESFEKQALPVGQIFAKGGPAILTLITCGGEFDRSEQSYLDNVVVRAIEITAPSEMAR